MREIPAAWIREALATRLAEAEQRLKTLRSQKSEVRSQKSEVGLRTSDLNATTCHGAEEALRVAMVRLWPKLASGRATAEERCQLLALLADTRELAQSDDWRFFDAWNNAYESLDFGAAPSPNHAPELLDFLEQYVRILRAQIDVRRHAHDGSRREPRAWPADSAEMPRGDQRRPQPPKGRRDAGPLRVLAVCESLSAAVRLWEPLRAVPEADYECLLLPGVTRRGFWQRVAGAAWFAARLAADFLRLSMAQRRAVGRLWLAGRLRIAWRGPRDQATLRRIRRRRPDVGLHALGTIYRRELLDCFRLGVLNPHIGLLPWYRGRSVMEWSLLEGAPTGVTVFFIDEGIDTGEHIVLRRVVEVDGRRTIDAAKRFLFSLDGQMFADALRSLCAADYQPTLQRPQDGRRYYVMSKLLRGVVSRRLAASGRAATSRHAA